MSLLDDLRAIDLSAVVDARAQIRLSVEAPELKAILEGKGVVEIALGDLGPSVARLEEIARDPKVLIEPVVEALGSLLGSFDVRSLPLGEYFRHVEEGVRLVVGLLKSLGGDPSNLGKAFGLPLGVLVNAAGRSFEGFRAVGPDGLVALNGLFAAVDRVPAEAEGFASLALDALSPFPRADLTRLRSDVRMVGERVAAMALPSGRTQGLQAAFEAVAAAPDAAALSRSLLDLGQVRAHTVESIAQDVTSFLSRLGGVDLEAVLGRIVSTAGSLRAAEEEVLSIFDILRQNLASLRAEVEALEAKSIKDSLALVAARAQDIVNRSIIAPLDAAAAAMEQWGRDLLSHLPLRELRGKLGKYIHQAADAVAEAGIDRYATTIRDELGRLRGSIESVDIAGKVKEALGKVEEVIARTLDAISGALEAIKSAIEAVADSAKPIVEKAAELLAQFRDLLTGIKKELEAVSIKEATQQIVEAVRGLRAKAEELFQEVELPEPARPLIDQLIGELEGLDIRGALVGPVKKALEGFDVLKQLKVDEALAEARQVIGNLVPTDLAKALEAEVGQALKVFESFDVKKLTGAMTAFFDDIARKIEGVASGPLIDLLHAPFKLILAALDQLHPRKLLAPAISLYRDALAGITFPDASTATRQLGQLFGSAGGAAERSVTAGRLGGEASANDGGGGTAGAGGGAEAPGGGSGEAGALVETELEKFKELRPGDFVRFLGYVPRKLREALLALDRGAAGALVRAIDSFAGGLARDLRALAEGVAELERRLESGLDDLLLPLGEAQARAQLAVSARFSGPGGASVDIDGSLLVLAEAGPASLRATLDERLASARERLGAVAAFGQGAVGTGLLRAAVVLESSVLARAVGDFDGFLAALDPEPIAAEIDAICGAALKKVPRLIDEIGDEMQAFLDDFRGKLVHLNPLSQAQRLLRVFDVLKEELSVLDPATLADDLEPIHAALVEAISAYDPASFSGEIVAAFGAIGSAVRALDPSAVLKPEDLAALTQTVDRVKDLVPTAALKDVAQVLAQAGATLEAVDLDGLLLEAREIPQRLAADVEQAAQEIAAEILAFLKALQFVSGAASASVEVSVEGGP